MRLLLIFPQLPTMPHRDDAGNSVHPGGMAFRRGWAERNRKGGVVPGDEEDRPGVAYPAGSDYDLTGDRVFDYLWEELHLG